MMLFKPKFWNTQNNIFSLMLLPLTLLVLIFIFFKRNLTKIKKFKIPIICIGNIFIGGTGKTPTSIFIAKEISKLRRNPVILKKFYKNQADEHNLIKSNFKNLILNKSRIKGIVNAIELKHDSVIMDDGFQDYKVKKDLNIICFNSNQLIGNGLVLPSGPLREGINSLKYAQIILINGKKNENFERKILKINKNLKIFYSYFKAINIDKFKNKNLLAIAGIGNPENFFNLIEEHNLKIKKKLVFPDHHEFTINEINKILDNANRENLQIIMTEKDYYKINKFKINRFEYLKVSLEVENKEKFISLIEEAYA
tara:strand:+ start:2643 stop:3575 length:933 start_codon:yes stop_codon:yes gene_type:complete